MRRNKEKGFGLCRRTVSVVRSSGADEAARLSGANLFLRLIGYEPRLFAPAAGSGVESDPASSFSKKEPPLFLFLFFYKLNSCRSAFLSLSVGRPLFLKPRRGTRNRHFGRMPAPVRLFTARWVANPENLGPRPIRRQAFLR